MPEAPVELVQLLVEPEELARAAAKLEPLSTELELAVSTHAAAKRVQLKEFVRAGLPLFV